MDAKQILLPFQATGEAAAPNSLFSITNTGDGTSISVAAPTGTGLHGTSESGTGVVGIATTGGNSDSECGVEGISDSGDE